MNRKEEVNELISRCPEYSFRFSNRVLSHLLSKADSHDNIAISPSRLQAVTALLANWATPETGQAILNALGSNGLSIKEVNALLSRQNIIPTIKESRYRYEVYESPTVEQSTSIWAEESLTIDQSALDEAKEDYNVSARNVDFSDSRTREIIDKSIHDATHGLIDHLDTEFSAGMVAAIIDILYFKAKWCFPFDEHDTKERLFYGTDGKALVNMMKITDFFKYARTNSAQIIRLPYKYEDKNDASFSMVIHLPQGKHTIEDVLRERESADFRIDLDYHEVTLSLPRLSVSSKAEMREILESMGMGFIFEKEDLIPKCIKGLMVSQILQQVKVKVKENGTEASAVTYVPMLMGFGSNEKKTKPIVMKVNRPFLFEIMEDNSRTVLFAGVINNIDQ